MQITLDVKDSAFNEFMNIISKFKDKVSIKNRDFQDASNNYQNEELSNVLKYALEIKKQLPNDFDPTKEKEEYFHNRFKI